MSIASEIRDFVKLVPGTRQMARMSDRHAAEVLGIKLRELDKYRTDGEEIYVRSTGAKLYYQPDDTWLLVGYAYNGSDVINAIPNLRLPVPQVPIGSTVIVPNHVTLTTLTGKLRRIEDYGHDTSLRYCIVTENGDEVAIYRSRWAEATRNADGAWTVGSDPSYAHWGN